jgi:hypothetical protein
LSPLVVVDIIVAVMFVVLVIVGVAHIIVVVGVSFIIRFVCFPFVAILGSQDFDKFVCTKFASANSNGRQFAALPAAYSFVRGVRSPEKIASTHMSSKRRKTSSDTLATGTTLTNILRLAHQRAVTDPDETAIAEQEAGPVTHNSLAADLHSLDGVQTPYGRLIDTFDFSADGSDPQKIHYVNPFALLSYLATVSLQFLLFLRSVVGNGPAGIYLYADGVTPGNDKRVDSGRKYVAWYWSFVDFPPWFHSRRDLSLFVLAYVPQELFEIKYSMAKVFRRFIHIFFSMDSFNFETTGVALQHGAERFVLKAKYTTTLADEQALRDLYAVKGSSGRKPCLKCKNVLGRVGSFEAFGDDGGYCLHVLNPNFCRCDFHTSESFAEMATSLETAVLAGERADNIAALEIVYGINYVVDGPLNDPHVRATTRVPEDIYFDPMHCIFASGGVGQYECNGILLALTNHGLTIQEIDEWIRNITLPPGRKLRKNFLEDRFVKDDGSHFRGFAGECIDAIVCINMFIDYVLMCTALATTLAKHFKCFRLLKRITDMLASKSYLIVAALDAAVEEHHHLFLELYPNMAKPKLHYIRHVPNSIKKKNVCCHVLGLKQLINSRSKSCTNHTEIPQARLLRTACIL